MHRIAVSTTVTRELLSPGATHVHCLHIAVTGISRLQNSHEALKVMITVKSFYFRDASKSDENRVIVRASPFIMYN